ncbi:metallophosphoesterase family protein [Mediannikoviicoccus vaginalis]|uniref:metallophosphoesterase family protein n=1 Tax=Mediannikoviicoccus vaginalis TaxID=2899727 RepID=UPI001F2A20B5|nr:DNA repair exonuclease [Mediannikoviicoccus vaginalis]
MKNNKLTFLHSGDFHLGSYFYSSDLPVELVENRRENIWASIESLFSYAKEKKTDCIFLCGDIFNENYVTLSILERLNSLFKTVPETKIFIIFGNHDPYSKNSKFKYLNLASNVFVFDDDNVKSFEFEDFNVYGISYTDRILNKSSYFEDIKLDRKKINILLLHTDILMPNFNYMNLNLSDIENLGFDYIALGHIHKPQKVKENIIYPGSLEPLSFKETGFHGAIYGEFENRKLYKKFIPLSSSIFTLVNYELKESFDFYYLLEHLKDNVLVEDKNNYIRLTLTGKLPMGFDLDIKGLEEALKKYVHYIEVIDNTEENYDIEKILDLNRENQIGIFIDKVNSLNESQEIKEKILKYGLNALMREDS